MREFKRTGGRDRKPSGRFGSGFGADRQRGRFSRDSGGSSGRFGRDADRPKMQSAEMHKVVCDKCRKECTVPFKPTSSKPVYCRDCFRKKDDSFSKHGFDARGSSDELAKIDQKLDKIMQALNIE